ncbi:MAG: DctP family TRAP transporter solute-binding subunit [Deltaproteobacteria bacterium]|nr:DctP family TRAP transporter solute-binding subunit [Deltaproteobacteria bacterium]
MLMAGTGICAEKSYELKFANVSVPTTPQGMAMDKFVEVVQRLSGGKIKVKTFHSGQLGDQKTLPLGCARGSIDMSVTSPAWMADLFDYPQVGVLDTVYLYKDFEHAQRILFGPIGKKFWNDIAAKGGVRVLDAWYLGTRELNTTEKAGPVRTPDDMKTIKLRMPNVEAWLDVGRALGAKPTPLGIGEVYMALKTGTIEAQDNPLTVDDKRKFYEVTKYIILTDHMINFVMPIINEKLWRSMPKEYQVYIKQAMRVARMYNDHMALEQETMLLNKFVTQYGLQVIIPNKEAFRAYSKKFYSQKKFDDRWGKGVYERIQSSE